MEKTTLRMAVRRTANPAQVAWEVSGTGVFGTLQLHAYVGSPSPVSHFVQPGYAAANGGVAQVSPNSAVHFWAYMTDSGPNSQQRQVTVDGNLLQGQTVAEVENHIPRS